MSDIPDSPDDFEPPSLSSWLLSFLSARRDEYEEQYAVAESEEEMALVGALQGLERRAAHLITTGVIPAEFAVSLQAFMPGDTVETKVRELLSYRIVQHRLEFDIAEDVCERLEALDKRVENVTILTLVLLGYEPSPTVTKYFQRASTLYLAGYEPEAIIMSGAVLEAALRTRFPDDLLIANGMTPIFKRTGDFSVGQRLKYEQRHPILEESHRKLVSELIDWRNDAVHIQPDLGPKAQAALVNLVLLLPKLLPGVR